MQYDEALADYMQALKLDPACADAYIGRGHVYLRLKQSDKAIENYKQSLKLEPGNKLVLFFLLTAEAAEAKVHN